MPQIPRVLSSARSQSIEEGMNQQLSHLLAHIRAIEPVLNLDSLGFYSRFFVVLKKELGKWRAILDVSVLNSITFVQKESFKMETAQVVREHLLRGE